VQRSVYVDNVSDGSVKLPPVTVNADGTYTFTDTPTIAGRYSYLALWSGEATAGHGRQPSTLHRLRHSALTHLSAARLSSTLASHRRAIFPGGPLAHREAVVHRARTTRSAKAMGPAGLAVRVC
jgi:hypothetical protein